MDELPDYGHTLGHAALRGFISGLADLVFVVEWVYTLCVWVRVRAKLMGNVSRRACGSWETSGGGSCMLCLSVDGGDGHVCGVRYSVPSR